MRSTHRCLPLVINTITKATPREQPATHGRITDIVKPSSDIGCIAGFHTLERHPRERDARPLPGARRCGRSSKITR